LRIIRAEEHRRMPWKNGGGETTEVLVSPHGAGLDDFDCRVSMALIGTDGPFSAFAGIDRTLSLIEGEGLALTIAGRPDVALTRVSAPLAFPGDVAVAARLVNGPVTDLNVMTRRGRWRHEVKRLVIEHRHVLACDTEVTLVLSRAQDLVVVTREGRAKLGRDDAALFEQPIEMGLEPTAGTATVFVVALRPDAPRGSLQSGRGVEP
jgi:uncharacterized protein